MTHKSSQTQDDLNLGAFCVDSPQAEVKFLAHVYKTWLVEQKMC